MAQKLGDLYKKLNTIRIAGFFDSEEDEEELAIAYGKYQIKKLEELWDKYKHRHDEAVVALEPKAEPEDEEEPVAETKVVDPNAKKALLTYKKLTRVLKYEMVKQTVLDNHNHTCFCCETTYPEKDEFKADHPDKSYPLFVRCNFPIVKYIESKELFEIKELIKDEKIFNSKNYSAICLDCKPSRFAK